MFLSPTDTDDGSLLPPAVLTPLGDDHLPPQGPCFGCGISILDRYYLIVSERAWHAECLKCCLCHVKLDHENSCFWRDGMVFCRDDYYRQFSKRCTRCHRALACNDFVMKARECMYHQQCFICIICSSPLLPGEYFALGDHGVLYCQSHYEPLLAMSSGCEDGLGSDCIRPSRSKKRRLKSSRNADLQLLGDQLMGSSDDIHHLGSINSATGRAKRMRTSFKHHQLRTMKAYFALNHNPDAKDLKQLAQKTGLTKRVLQVWFQNARAKYRRAVQIKTEGKSGQNSPLKKESNTDEGSESKADMDQSSVHSSLNDYDMKLSPDLSDDTASKTLAEYFHENAALL